MLYLLLRIQLTCCLKSIDCMVNLDIGDKISFPSFCHKTVMAGWRDVHVTDGDLSSIPADQRFLLYCTGFKLIEK